MPYGYCALRLLEPWLEGEILQRPRPDMPPVLKLETRGAEGDVYWLINGRMLARQSGKKPFYHRPENPGRLSITAMDDFGHFDRVNVSVR